ncbi:hypothetical protein LIER_25185 [Lithospermum erythrorhizon]|uniref:Pentatricopeptide repeat-containing protein n=1 Tax=Lithospermum erythrorhizon TaxID=34254 RepID=A0AAV3R3U1_LITER
MSLFKHLPRLSKTLRKPLKTINSNTTNFYYSTLLTSKPTINQTLTNHTINHLTFFLTFSRLLHTGNLSNTFTTINPIDHNSVEQVEKICQKISSITDPKSIHSVLKSVQVEFSSALVEQVLRRLSNSGVLALSFFRFAEKQRGFECNVDCYNALVESLGKIKQFKMVWVLIDEMKRKGLLGRETFALVSRRYARARKVKEAIEAFEKMEKYGLKPELDDYNRILDTLSKSRHVGKAQEVFDKWKNIKFRPSIKSYTILLEGWGQEQNLLRLDEVYREMTADGFEPDVVSYGILINAYCKAKKYDKAIELYNEMERKGIKATPHVYCTLINSLGSDRRLDEALKFFELAKGCGYPLESPTYNSVVGAYCWSVRMHDAYRVVDEMRKCGVGPNSRTYDIILHHLVKVGRKKEAYSVFQNISKEPGCEPTVSTYEIIIRMFCNEDRTDMAVRVWNQMKARGVLPGMHMFSTLINSLCHENKLDDACKYFQEMLDMGIRPPCSLFSNLKQTLLDEGKSDTVVSLSQRVEKLRKTQIVK